MSSTPAPVGSPPTSHDQHRQDGAGPTTSASQAPLRRSLLRNPFVWAALAGFIAIPLLRPLLRHVPKPPPVLFQLPAFSLIDQNGHQFGSAQLRGHVYLATFFFSHCSSICPKLMHGMLALQRRYEQFHVDIKLVSISVDPTVDTPAVLRAYGHKLGIDFSRWSLLTGTEQQVRDLVEKGFKSYLGQKQSGAAGRVDIAHPGAIALVDAKGGFRGFYNTDPEGLDEVFHRSLHVRYPE